MAKIWKYISGGSKVADEKKNQKAPKAACDTAVSNVWRTCLVPILKRCLVELFETVVLTGAVECCIITGCDIQCVH